MWWSLDDVFTGVGFGFVGFDSEDVVEKLAQARFHTINGKSVSERYSQCVLYNNYASLAVWTLSMILLLLNYWCQSSYTNQSVYRIASNFHGLKFSWS